MSVDLLSRVRGPAVIHFMGQDFYTSNASAWETVIDPFMIDSDAFGPLDQRFNNRVLTLTFNPVGVWTEEQLAVLYQFAGYRRGQLNTPAYTVSAVSTGAGTLTVTAHGIIAGTGVRIGAIGTGASLPGGLATNTTYYVAVVDANTIKLCTTEANAIAGTSPVTLTSVGAGTIRLIQNSPMTVQTFDGVLLTIQNAGLVQMPGLNLSAVKTPFKQAKYEGYSLHGSEWSDANSLYTIVENPFSGEAPDPNDIPTVPLTVDWGTTITGLQPREEVDIDFPIKLAEIMSDRYGILCRSIDQVDATAQFIPTNMSETDLATVQQIQGTGAARGASLPFDTLNIYGPENDPYVSINGAALTNGPMAFGTSEDRIGKLMFKNKRTFGAGAANPVFYVGTTTP